MINKWTNEEIENLFNIAKNQNFKNIEYEINENSKIIQIIKDKFSTTRDNKSILYKLANMNFFHSKKNSKRDGFFYRNDNISYEDFKTSPDYIKFDNSESNILDNNINIFLEKSENFEELIQKFKELLKNRSDLNIHKELFNKKYIIYKDNEYCSNIKDCNFKKSSKLLDLTDLINDKKIDSELKSQINELREQNSYIYNPYNPKDSNIKFINDGTGFGKSYGVFDQFIKNINSEASHKNMFFMTPLKSQIKLDENLILKAKKNNIEILSYLSIGDVCSLNFSDWITQEKNEDRYLRWNNINKDYKGSLIKDELLKLKGIIESLSYYESMIETNNLDIHEIEKIKDDILIKKSNLYNLITEIALKIININGEKLRIDEIFIKGKEDNIYKLYSEIIKFAFPLEFSKYNSCILLSTTDKFDYNIKVLKEKKDNTYTSVSKSFYDLLGYKKENKEEISEIGKYIGQSHSKQIEFLKDQYFVIDEDNEFYQKNISFQIVIDEEHDSYKKFFKKGTVKLIDKDCKLEDVIASIYRLYISSNNSLITGHDYGLSNDETREFILNINKLYKEHCDCSSRYDLKSVLKMFSNNINGIFIDGNQIEHISNITKNVFNFSSKRFFNEKSLKKLYFRSHNEDTICEIYSKDESDDISMYDMYQIIMIIIAASSQIKLNGKLHKSLGLRDNKNHNKPLHLFISKANSIKKDIEYIFNRNEVNDLIIDYFFTYFQPKTVLSIIRRNDFNFIPESKGIIYVDFDFELRKELPEINIIKLLYGTKNSIITLSATSGIFNNYTGNYNRLMLNKYSVKNDFDYKVINRDETESIILENLRKKRSEIRTLTINEIPIDSIILKDETTQSNFNSVYLKWKSKLNIYVSKNKYHRIEHERQLKSLLLASFDKKNTLVLSLTNNFIRTIKKYILSEQGKIDRSIRVINSESNPIFEFTPFKDNHKLIVIPFNSDMDKVVDVKKYTEIKDTNTNICFISSYSSAGTGLNYFVKYKDLDGNVLEEDFERLVLVNNPYYSEIKDKDGLNTIDNYITLLKYFSCPANTTKYLEDFSTNLVNGENYKILINEHNLALFKIMLQAIGRVERRDTKLNTEIYIPEDVIKQAVVQFINLKNEPKNKTMINSMSLLNNNFMKYCTDIADRKSFVSQEDRNRFENKIIQDFKSLKDLMEEMILKEINKFRNRIVDDISINELFRSPDLIFNPEKAINDLKNNEYIKKNKLENIIDRMYIDTEINEFKNILICKPVDNDLILSDISKGGEIYNPYEFIIPSYNERIIKDEESLAYKLFNNYYNKEKNRRYFPNPYLIPLLLGNMGEKIFSDLLCSLNIKPLSPIEIKNKIDSTLYELFDFYIEVNESLVCIDVKNWSNTSDKEEISVLTHEKAEKKIKTVKDCLTINNISYKNISFVYVNTKFENNELNVETECNLKSNIFYLNLFKTFEEYKTDEKNTNKVYINDKFILNNILETILKKGKYDDKNR